VGKLTTWPWPLTFDVTAHVGDAGHRTPSLYRIGLSIRKLWRIFRLSINQPRPLTFRPLKVVTGQLLPASCQFAWLGPSILELGSGRHGTDRQTERQTTAINALCPPSYGYVLGVSQAAIAIGWGGAQPQCFQIFWDPTTIRHVPFDLHSEEIRHSNTCGE